MKAINVGGGVEVEVEDYMQGEDKKLVVREEGSVNEIAFIGDSEALISIGETIKDKSVEVQDKNS